MKRNVIKWLSVTILVAVLVLLPIPKGVAQADGIPPIPHAFYGCLRTTDNGVAPAGVEVRAKVNGEWAGDPLITSEAGQYGGPDFLDPKLIVQGDILDGTPIDFYVEGFLATPDDPEKAKFYSEQITELCLTYTPPPPPPEPTPPAAPVGVGPTPPRPTLEVIIEKEKATYLITTEGKLLEDVSMIGEGGCLEITLLKGTIALSEKNKPLDNITISVDENPPSPPEGASIIGLPYSFNPSGAKFDPAATLKWCYDPADIPEGVAEKDLVIAYYDEKAGKWVELECVVDTVNNIITASVSHFTTFARIAWLVPAPPPLPPTPEAAFLITKLSIQPTEVMPNEIVTITVSVANTGGMEGTYTVVLMIDGAKEAEKAVTIPAGESKDVTFSVTREEVGTYSVAVERLSGSFDVKVIPVEVPPAKPPINWMLLGGIIAAVIVVILLILFAARRRRRAY